MTGHRANWSRQGFLHRPASFNPSVNSSSTNPCSFGPVRKHHAFAVKRYDPIVSAIPPLFVLGCPVTVILAIISIVIDSFYAIRTAWPLPHLFHEHIERVNPLLAHLNASSTVVLVRRVLAIVTSPLHARPHAILQSSGPAVFSSAVSKFFPLETPATLTLPPSQLSSTKRLYFPTVANAIPKWFTPLSICRLPFDDQKPPESSTRQVNQVAFGCFFSMQAPTTLRHSIPKTFSSDNRNASTLALTFPANPAVFPLWVQTFYGEPAALHAGHVFSPRTELTRNRISHETFLCTEGTNWLGPALRTTAMSDCFIIAA